MSELADRLESATAPALVTHRRADRDSLGSALGLRALLGAGTICTPAGIRKPARELCEVTEATIHEGGLPEEYDEIVVLDAPSTDRIAPVDPDSILLIDHHEPSDLADRADLSLVDTDAGATAELVTRLAVSADWSIGPDAALPLLVGVLDDTDWLGDGGPQTAATVATLFEALDDKATMLPTLLDQSMGRDERIASATGVLRGSGYRAGDLFVAVSHVGAHEGTAAEALRDAGVDLAVVYSTQSDEMRVTARASDRMADQISLGATLLPAIAAEFGGDGGGHAAAGSATVRTTDTNAVVDTLLTAVESELGLTFSDISN